jgi:hypothetical protein
LTKQLVIPARLPCLKVKKHLSTPEEDSAFLALAAKLFTRGMPTWLVFLAVAVLGEVLLLLLLYAYLHAHLPV